MLLTIVPPVILALLVGFCVKLILDKIGGENQITRNEYLIGSAIIILVVAPLVGFTGWHLARSNLVTFNEYRNGWETAAERNDFTCTEDGPCRWTYNCNPYVVYVSETCTDSKGNSYECGHFETRYHQCPYVDVETTYTVETTLGQYTIAEHRFPENPQAHRWDQSENIPGGIIERAGTGIPTFWSQVWQRISKATPDPVTARRDYKNYILASDKTILKQYSSDIERYRKQNLLPPIASSISGYYDAEKVSFVGYRPSDGAVWQGALNRLNAAFGTELRGDVHMVIIRSDIVDEDPDSYALALKAFWQDKKVFGQNAFSKNGVGIVLGTHDQKMVAWARAFTGMPLGNEHMTVALESALKGQPLDPSIIVGSVGTSSVVTVNSSRVSLQITKMNRSGLIAQIFWGDSDKSLRFTRMSMTGKGSGHGSGFLYLYSEISPTAEQRRWISVITFILACVFWVVAAFFDFNDIRRSRYC